MRTKPFFIFLLAALIFGGLAVGQSILGSMFKLGSSTVATLPASSSTITGSLIYVTDDAGVNYNTGSSWVKMVDVNNINQYAGNFWADAGTGSGNSTAYQLALGASSGSYIFANTSPTSGYAPGTIGRQRNTQTGIVFPPTGGMEWGVGTSVANTFLHGNSTTFGLDFGSSSSATPEWRFLGGAGAGTYPGTLPGTKVSAGLFSGNAASGSNSVAIVTSGSRMDVGAGTSDYFNSDGTGITTPSYWDSSRAFSSGPGIIGNSVKSAGATFASFTQTNATALGSDVIVHNDTVGTMWQTFPSAAITSGAGVGFMPMGTEHAMQRQTVHTTVLGSVVNTFPEIAERIPCASFGGAGSTVQMYWVGAATTSSVVNGRQVGGIASIGDGSQKYGVPACSSASTTPYAFIATPSTTSGGLTHCQRLSTYSDLTSTIIWSLFTTSIPTADATTLNASGFGFRYASSVGSTWYACYYDTATTCADTGITVSASTDYLLCEHLSGTGAIVYTVNGVYTNGATPASFPVLGYPLVSLDPTASVTRALNVGPFSVESM